MDRLQRIEEAIAKATNKKQLRLLYKAQNKERFRRSAHMKEGVDIRSATHVKVGGTIEKIVDKWGINEDGSLARLSEGGYGVLTESGKRVDVFHVESYLQEEPDPKDLSVKDLCDKVFSLAPENQKPYLREVIRRWVGAANFPDRFSDLT